MKKNKNSLFNAPQRKGLDYTQRQLDILNDEIPLERIRTTELVMLIRRAAEREDEVNLDIAKDLYEAKVRPNEYEPSLSVDDAKAVLQRLTPWIINWSP